MNGVLYSPEQKERVRDLLDWLTSVFTTQDIAALAKIPATTLSHAKHHSMHTDRGGLVDGIGKSFVERLANAVGLPEDDLLKGAANWPDRKARVIARLSLKIQPRRKPLPIRPRKPLPTRAPVIPREEKTRKASGKHWRGGRKSVESKIAKGLCYNETQKTRVRAVVAQAVEQFGARGLAALMGIDNSRVSHALHAQKNGRRDRIGPAFVKALAAALCLEPEVILSGTSSF